MSGCECPLKELPWIDLVEIVDLKKVALGLPFHRLDGAGAPRGSRVTGDRANRLASWARRVAAVAPGSSHKPRWGLRFFSSLDLVAAASVDPSAHTIQGCLGSVPLFFAYDHSGEISRAFLKEIEEAPAAVAEAAAARAKALQQQAQLAAHIEEILSDKKGTRWKRAAKCKACGVVTTQTLHGLDESGHLWKGHLCACEGWHCATCGEIAGRVRECCR